MVNQNIKPILVFFFLAVSTVGNQIFACECGLHNAPKMEEHINEVDLIVVGKVVEIKKVNFVNGKEVEYIEPVGDTLFHGFDFDHYKITIDIYETLKGKFKKGSLKIFTGNGLGDCGYHFEVGASYLIYGFEFYRKKRVHAFSTSICTRTSFYNMQEISEIRRYLELKKNVGHTKQE